MKHKVKGAVMGYAYLAPALILFVVFIGGPLVYSLCLSFTRYNMMKPMKFIGMDNFRELFQDDRLGLIYGNTFKYLGILLPAHVIVGLLLAVLVHAVSSQYGNTFTVLPFTFRYW